MKITSPMSTIRRVTLRDIAARIGVSHVTVSLALKNHPDISKERREQVQALAKEMGYRPDPALSSLMVYRQSRKSAAMSSPIAWVNHCDHPTDMPGHREFKAYWQGASESAERFGYHLVELIWPGGCSPERFEKILLTRNIRGVLIPPHQKQLDWGSFHWENFCAIRFGLSARSPDAHVVSSDQLRMVMMAIGKIHEYGYERIGFIVPKDTDIQLGGSFSGGYFASQHMYGLKVKLPPLMTDTVVEEKDPKRTLKEFEVWYKKNKPDAILTTVASTRDHLRALHLSVPGDVALAGTSVGDLNISAGIDQNSFEIGRTAVETLISLINNNDRGRPAVPRRILIEGFWQDGDSLPPRRADAVENS